MRLRATLGIPAVALALFVTTSFAADMGSPSPNQLYGHITTNRTLTYASPGPTYEVIGDLTIDAGATLTIERGVKLIATANSDFLASGADRQRVELAVAGSLVVPPGTDSVVFRSTSSRHAWYGIAAEGLGTLALADASIDGATHGVRGALGSVAFQRVSISHCDAGVRTTGNVTLDRLRLSDCTDGIECASGSLLVTNSTLLGAVGTGGTAASVYSGAVAQFRNCVVANWALGMHAFDGARLDVTECEVRGVASGMYFDGGGTGSVTHSTIVGTSTSNIGIGFAYGVTLTSTDSLAPEPTRIQGFDYGVALFGGPPATLDHLIISGCTYGVNAPSTDVTVSYSTLVDNGTGVVCGGTPEFPGAVLNCVIVARADGSAAGGLGAVNYTDAWGGAALNFGHFGPAVSCFNPFFVAGDSTYHLSPASFFLNFSCSGGQIGAYGPGPVGPTPVMSASVISADAADGAAKIRWYVGAGGEKASVVRKTEGGDWEPNAVLFRDGSGYVTLEDRDVTPGTRYGYAIGTQNDGQIGIDGEVWVTVEQHVTELTRPVIAPNPSRDGWNVAFAVPSTAPAKIEVLDVSGRLLHAEALGQLTVGQNSVYVPSTKFSPGVYWVRVRQGEQTTMTKAVKAN